MYAAVVQVPVRTPVQHRSVMRARRLRTLRTLAVLVVLAAVLVFAPRAVQTMAHSDIEPRQAYTVARGDTLWDIAAAHSNGRDVRLVVSDIKRENRLKSADIEPGQQLVVPR